MKVLLEFDMVEEPMESNLELVGSKELVGSRQELVESKLVLVDCMPELVENKLELVESMLEDCIEELGSCNPEQVVNIREWEHCTLEQEGCNKVLVEIRMLEVPLECRKTELPGVPRKDTIGDLGTLTVELRKQEETRTVVRKTVDLNWECESGRHRVRVHDRDRGHGVHDVRVHPLQLRYVCQ